MENWVPRCSENTLKVAPTASECKIRAVAIDPAPSKHISGRNRATPRQLTGKTIRSATAGKHMQRGENERGPEMWWRIPMVLCMWSLAAPSERRGPVVAVEEMAQPRFSESRQKPPRFMEVRDQNTHEKGSFGRGDPETQRLQRGSHVARR